jgi:hypothetical protein
MHVSALKAFLFRFVAWAIALAIATLFFQVLLQIYCFEKAAST